MTKFLSDWVRATALACAAPSLAGCLNQNLLQRWKNISDLGDTRVLTNMATREFFTKKIKYCFPPPPTDNVSDIQSSLMSSLHLHQWQSCVINCNPFIALQRSSGELHWKQMIILFKFVCINWSSILIQDTSQNLDIDWRFVNLSVLRLSNSHLDKF